MKIRQTAALAAALTIAVTQPTWAAGPYALHFGANPDRRETLQQRRDPGTAAVLSALFPGVGQIYAGNWQRGLVITGIGVGLAVLGVGFMSVMADKQASQDPGNVAPIVTGIGLGAFHLWNIRDAYYTSDAINTDLEERARGTTLPKGPPF